MKRKQIKPLALAIAGCLYVSASLQVALADDTEIYVPKEVPADQQIRPNILLILDTSGSMTTTVANTGGKQRIQVLREVVHNLVDDLKDKNVNLGFMRFHGSDGGAVTKAVEQLTPGNTQDFLNRINDTIVAGGNTPMSETYYESYLYLAGKQPHWGSIGSVQRNGTDPNALVNPSASCTSSTKCNWQYKSPISHSCQKTHIVYITDGAPVSDNSSNNDIKGLLEKTAPQGGSTNPAWKKTTCTNNVNGQCLPHLAEYMYNQDIAAENGYPKKFSDPTNRMQNVTSHFVGFALDLPLLVNAAAAGGGHYFTSDTASGLADALKSIIVDITAANTTFVAPSVAVTAYNNFGFRDELYYALFRPSEGTNWLGNVKKYKLKTQDADGKPITPVIVDRNGTQAIDPETGFFKQTSSSFWNTVVDGEDVGKGGFASNMTPGSRKIYTWFGNDKKAGNAGSAETLKVFSTNGSSSHTNSDTNISNAMLGVSTTSQRKEVINWIMGKKTDGTGNRMAIGDILHNEPRLIAYTTDEDIVRAEGSNSKEEVTIFVGTNEGFIHAINAETGEEKFAFLPKELLHIPEKYRADSKSYNNKAYGMDGYFTALTQYGNKLSDDTRKISKAYLYAGMRRGGSNYYALDVKDLNSPKLKWVLKGAYKDNYRDLIYQDATNENYSNIYRPTSGTTDITPGFERLGLTYSAAKIGKLKVNGSTKDVLVFTGGYDVKHDVVGNNVPKNDEVGNAIYIVDAETGELLWRASGSNGRQQVDTAGLNQLTLSSMTNSMPASPTLIDINNDGLIDIIYATDLRGQIFRFDIAGGNVGQIKGHRFANLGGSDKANNRRFFNSPDVALIRDRGQAPYFTVSIGSGFRENPLNEETDDRFYMIRDTYVTQSRSALSSPPVITENDLADVSGLDDNDANAQAVYDQVAQLQEQIDQLENTVRGAEYNFESHKNTIGYTALREQYLALTTQAADKMRDADGKIMGFYPPFDADNYDLYAQYNPSYYAQHNQETTAQHGLQQIKMELLNAIRDMDPTDAKTQTLANLYAGLETMQSALEGQAKVLVEKENFILKGHAYPDLTEDLKNKIDSKFPGAITDYSGYGDFSDLANPLDANLELQYATHVTNGTNRETINSNLADLQSKLATLINNPSSYDMDDIKALLPGVDDSGSADISGILAGIDQEQTKLDASASRKNAHNQLVSDVTALHTERDNLLAAAVLVKNEADAMEGTFQHYLDLIDEAYAATRHPTTGIYALRVKINDEYKKLDLAGDTMTDEQKALLLNSSGFMLRLPRGEKVLADSISYSGTVLFSTFSPRGEAVSECGSDVGIGRTYGLSLRTAEGVFTTEIGGDTKYIRSMVNKQAGIPPTPVILVTPEGTEGGLHDGIYTTPNDSPINPTYWREEQ